MRGSEVHKDRYACVRQGNAGRSTAWSRDERWKEWIQGISAHAEWKEWIQGISMPADCNESKAALTEVEGNVSEASNNT